MSVQAEVRETVVPAPAGAIPVIDIGPYLAAVPGAIDEVAGEIHRACTEIGFFFIVNHGMDEGIVEHVFEASRGFFALPMEEKMKVRMNRHQCGFMPPNVAVHSDTFETRQDALRAQISEAFKFTFDLGPDDPDFGKNRRFRGHNKWPDPDAVPGLHEAFMAFHVAFETLGRRLLAPLSVSLGMPAGHFDPFFERSSSMTRIAYYPQIDAAIDPITLPGHRDISFLSMIPPATRPGLEIQLPSGQWIEQPVIPEGILVNTGNTMVRWINDAYIATPHRARADAGEARYSNIFFLYPNVDAMMECVPSCQSADNPAKYPPIRFGDFHAEYAARNFGYAEDWD
jgi:isopenicillin N synthase-like dioxygenase